MVAATPRHVRGRLRQRSGPEPIGSTAESNQPYVLPLGADDTGSQITGPDTGGSLPPVMRAFCVLRARLRKDKHNVTARGVLTYSALVSHLAGTRRIGRGLSLEIARTLTELPKHSATQHIQTMRPNGLTGIQMPGEGRRRWTRCSLVVLNWSGSCVGSCHVDPVLG